MREAIGGTWLFQIVIAFVLLFTGFMCITINQSKAYNVKNFIINTIERESVIDLQNTKNDIAIQQIVDYLKDISYRTTGKCPNNYIGIGRDGSSTTKDAAFCILKQDAHNGNSEFQQAEDVNIANYYRVVVFYQLDLPIFNQVFNFTVKGDTKIMTSSYSRNGVYRINGQKCMNYKNGKAYGNEFDCSTVSEYIIN